MRRRVLYVVASCIKRMATAADSPGGPLAVENCIQTATAGADIGPAVSLLQSCRLTPSTPSTREPTRGISRVLRRPTMLFKSAIKSAFAAHAPLTRTNLAVGDSIPAGTTLVKEFPNELVDVPARLAGKKTIVVGLPGAFTPT